MPPPIDHLALTIQTYTNTFYLVKIGEQDPLSPDLIEKLANPSPNQFISVTRCADETSIMTDFEWSGMNAVEVVKWKGFRLTGPLDFGLVGIMHALTTPLRQNEISVFVISTWNTDYLLVPVEKGPHAVSILKADGWTFTSE